MLAAIVFTDVVGFSRLASQNEARVFGALQRDMSVMTSLCRTHSGQVLNTMGDGMLLCFMSAVDAMTCAIEVQQTLYNQAKSLPPSEVLHHRIGIHLGDIIMSGDNVFGDGVNIAARLQGVAKPDSVCFSQTVYDVVKNKLKLNATYVGNQQLKNLGQPVKIWMLPPLDVRKPVDFDPLPPPVEPSSGTGGWRSVVMVAVSVLLVAGIFFAFKSMKMPTGSALRAKAKAGAPSDGESKTSPVIAPKTKAAVAKTEFEVAKEVLQLRNELNFARIVELVEAAGSVAPPAERTKLATYRELSMLMQYLDEQVAKTSPSNKIRFDLPSGEQAELFTMGGALQLVGPDGIPTPTNWSQLGIAKTAAIARSLSEFQVGRTGAAPAGTVERVQALERELNVAPNPTNVVPPAQNSGEGPSSSSTG